MVTVEESDVTQYYNNIFNYTIVRRDRLTRGGVAIHIHNTYSLEFKIVAKSWNNSAIEYIFITLLPKGLRFGIGVVYKAPNVKYNELLVLHKIL